MKVRFFCCALILAISGASSAFSATGVHKILTFETAPENVEDDFDGSGGGLPELSPGAWGTREEENRTSEHRGSGDHPTWSSGGSGGSGGSNGWIEPIGEETPFNNRGPIGGANYEGIPTTAILTNLFTGVAIYDNDSWGDVSNATFLTMDVKGSFTGTGGISVFSGAGADGTGAGGTLWSWTAAVSNEAVGANPGDVTEWTTLLIPINRPTVNYDAGVFPSANGTEGRIDGALEDGGNWGVNGTQTDSATMMAAFDSIMSTVNRIDVRGLTPDTQIDNLGFILPAAIGTPGDFDSDEDVDGADFLLWQRDMGVGNLADWEANFGTVAAVGAASAVPEPTTIALALFAGCGLLCTQRKR